MKIKICLDIKCVILIESIGISRVDNLRAGLPTDEVYTIVHIGRCLRSSVVSAHVVEACQLSPPQP